MDLMQRQLRPPIAFWLAELSIIGVRFDDGAAGNAGSRIMNFISAVCIRETLRMHFYEKAHKDAKITTEICVHTLFAVLPETRQFNCCWCWYFAFAVSVRYFAKRHPT